MLLKKIVASLLAGVLISTFSLSVYAQNNTVNIDGVSRRLQVNPVIADGSQLVGMRDIGNLLGGVVWLDENTGEAVVKSPEIEVRVKIGSTEASVSGRKVMLPVHARIVGNHTMIPLRFIAEAFGYSVGWDQDRNEAVLVKVRVKNSGSDKEQAEPVKILNYDKLEKGKTVLEYDDAVAKVVAKNSTIKDLDDWYRRLGDKRREVYYDYVWPGWSHEIPPYYTAGLRTMSEIDFRILNTPLNKEMMASRAEAALRGVISTIITTRMDMMVLDENIRLSKFNLENNLELRLELGLASEIAVRDARRALEQLQVQRDMLRLSYISEKESLALLLGYGSNEDISVDYRPLFVEEDIDVDRLIREIPKDPSIVTAERKYLQAKYELETTVEFFSHTRQESREDKRIAMESARREWEDAKTDMEKNIRSRYNTIKSLEENHKSLELALEKARDAYATALVNLEAGMITRYDADMARMGILKAEVDLEKNINNLDNMRFALERPYLLAGRS